MTAPMMFATVFAAVLVSMHVSILVSILVALRVTIARIMSALRAMAMSHPGYVSRRISVSHSVTECAGITGLAHRVSPDRYTTSQSTIWITVIATGTMSKDRSGNYEGKHSAPCNLVNPSHNDISFCASLVQSLDF